MAFVEPGIDDTIARMGGPDHRDSMINAEARTNAVDSIRTARQSSWGAINFRQAISSTASCLRQVSYELTTDFASVNDRYG